MSIIVPSEYRSLLWFVSSLLFEVFIIIDDLISDASVLYWEYEDFTKKTTGNWPKTLGSAWKLGS